MRHHPAHVNNNHGQLPPMPGGIRMMRNSIAWIMWDGVARVMRNGIAGVMRNGIARVMRDGVAGVMRDGVAGMMYRIVWDRIARMAGILFGKTG